MTASRPAALIVEDQPFVGMVASDILRESGYETFHAYDAGDAVTLLGAHPEIEVVVTEARLPGDIDGLELCRRLSKAHPDVQLVITGTGNELKSGDMPSGTRVLRKPYASGELRTVVAAKALLSEV